MRGLNDLLPFGLENRQNFKMYRLKQDNGDLVGTFFEMVAATATGKRANFSKRTD